MLFPAWTRKQQRIENMRKHHLRESCSCHFDCRRLISEARRRGVWAEFWLHLLEPRKAFTRSLIDDMGPGKNLRYHSGGSRGVGGATGANAPPSKNRKNISFKPFLKVFGPLQCFCVCHTTENDLVTCTRWTWAPANPLTSRSLHKNTPLHLLWHFKVTHKEISSDSIRVILPMLVRGQLLILS